MRKSYHIFTKPFPYYVCIFLKVLASPFCANVTPCCKFVYIQHATSDIKFLTAFRNAARNSINTTNILPAASQHIEFRYSKARKVLDSKYSERTVCVNASLRKRTKTCGELFNNTAITITMCDARDPFSTQLISGA